MDDLATRLSNVGRIGLTAELASQLRMPTFDIARARLLAGGDDGHGPLGVYLLSVYVVDDTDFWSDGEIYWWCIPVLGHKDGTTSWSPMSGIPAGAEPHSVGSHEWMTNFSLREPPLVAVIPSDDDVTSCVLRLAFYDDDGAVANVPRAMQAGYEVLASCKNEGLSGPDQIILPVREAIFRSLRAEQDDILIDEDITLRRGEVKRFNVGFVGSVVNSMIRIYYLVRDEERTVQAGPVMLRKGQVESIRFDCPLERGGRLAVFARGADVHTSAFGDLTNDNPFVDRVLDEGLAISLSRGFSAESRGNAKLISFYTPP